MIRVYKPDVTVVTRGCFDVRTPPKFQAKLELNHQRAETMSRF